MGGKALRAVGYVRISRLDKDTTSPDRQREIVAELCSRRGWGLLEVFEDLDVSGGKESRKGLDAMLAQLGDVDAVVTWKLDRLARSLPHLLKLGEAFERAGVQLITADGEVDTTTAGGRAFFQMRGVFAEFERNTVGERAQAMHDWLRAQGRIQSRIPFGFRANEERRLERDPGTWPTLVSMIERVARGDSLRRVGSDFGLPHTTIRVYVRNRRAIDSLEQDRPDLAAALRARFADETFRPGPRSLLSGLARCSVCGTRMRQGRRDGLRVYSCKAGGHVHVNADWLDESVVHDVLRLAPWAIPQRGGKGPTPEDRTALERKLAELQDEYDDGLVTRERYVSRRDRIFSRLKQVETPAPRPRLERATWEQLSGGERRLALREVLDAVEILQVPPGKARAGRHPERVLLVFK